MRLGRRGAKIVLAAALAGLLLLYLLRLPTLIELIPTVLYFVLLGYLIECDLLPPTLWPFGRINLFELAISAACLVAALASALGIPMAGAHRNVVVALAVIMIVLLCGGLFFLVKGTVHFRR